MDNDFDGSIGRAMRESASGEDLAGLRTLFEEVRRIADRLDALVARVEKLEKRNG